ncbi:hypothetical protein SME17J_47470 (plasmid) [Serratia marcescens]|nr:hypothetical protein SME17J_47470 [Serratia marcescens]
MEYITIILVLLLISCGAFYLHIKKMNANHFQLKKHRKKRM